MKPIVGHGSFNTLRQRMSPERRVANEKAAACMSQHLIEGLTPVIHEENGRYWAEIPAMPGCYSDGDTLEEVRSNIIEVAQGWIQSKLCTD